MVRMRSLYSAARCERVLRLYLQVIGNRVVKGRAAVLQQQLKYSLRVIAYNTMITAANDPFARTTHSLTRLRSAISKANSFILQGP